MNISKALSLLSAKRAHNGDTKALSEYCQIIIDQTDAAAIMLFSFLPKRFNAWSFPNNFEISDSEFSYKNNLLYYSGKVLTQPCVCDKIQDSRNHKLAESLREQGLYSHVIIPWYDQMRLLGSVIICFEKEELHDVDLDLLQEVVSILFSRFDSDISTAGSGFEKLPHIKLTCNLKYEIIAGDIGTSSDSELSNFEYSGVIHSLLSKYFAIDTLEPVYNALHNQVKSGEFVIRTKNLNENVLLKLVNDNNLIYVSLIPFDLGHPSTKVAKTFHPKVVSILTDSNFNILNSDGDLESVLGIDNSDSEEVKLQFNSLIKSQDLRKLRRLVSLPSSLKSGFLEEIRVFNQKTSTYRWVMISAFPVMDKSGELVGWSGFGFDTDEKHRAQIELELQSRKLEVMLNSAKTVDANLDPAVVCLKNIKSLKKAISAEHAFALFLNEENKFDLVAADGHSTKFISRLENILEVKNSIVRAVVDSRQALLIDDLSDDTRAKFQIAEIDRMKSTIFAPLVDDSDNSDPRVLGIIVLSSKQKDKFNSKDLDLVSVVSQQIANVIRKSKEIEKTRVVSEELESLYKLNNSISKASSAIDVTKAAFPVIQESTISKRMWIGVLNEQRTHIIGCSGSNISASVVNIQLELGIRHDFLDEAVRTLQPVFVPKGTEMECSALNTIINHLQVGDLIIIPMIALRTLVGVLVIEPITSINAFKKLHFSLLNKMLGELANVILARRFESRLVAVDKMRMAGLLASGVAHNFNNLLQSILGQASLLELQGGNDPLTKVSVSKIIEASEQGANLIRQLMTMTQYESIVSEKKNLIELLTNSIPIYQSLLSEEITFQTTFEVSEAYVKINEHQIHQVISNLILNAKEAVAVRKEPKIELKLRKVRTMSGEVDPELSPGEYFRIDIIDNGVGMNEDAVKRCFEPFFSNKNIDSQTGVGVSASGLGLSLAYSVIKQHAGVIIVESQLNVGTTISVFLPIHNATEEKEAGEQQQILVIGDSALYRIVDEHTDYEVVLLSPNMSLVSLLLEQVNNPILILIDLDENRLVIPDYIREIRKIYPTAQICGITNSSDDWQSLLKFYDYISVISKPFLETDLSKILEERREGGYTVVEHAIPGKYGGH